jgi:hypothetical protein
MAGSEKLEDRNVVERRTRALTDEDRRRMQKDAKNIRLMLFLVFGLPALLMLLSWIIGLLGIY